MQQYVKGVQIISDSYVLYLRWISKELLAGIHQHYVKGPRQLKKAGEARITTTKLSGFKANENYMQKLQHCANLSLN